MKTFLVTIFLFAIILLDSGCASFGYSEIENAIPVEDGKVRVFGAFEFSSAIGNELVFRKYISDTVKYEMKRIYEQSPYLCLVAHAGGTVGISNSDALSIRIQTVVFPKSAGIKLGYRKLLVNTSPNYLAGYLNVGYSKVFDYVFYDAALNNDEDNSKVRFYSEVIHYKSGIVFTHQTVGSEGNTSKIYLGASVQLNQASTEVRGGISYFRLTSPNYDYKILDKQKHNWLTLIPYGGFTLDSRDNSVVEFAFPFWYDSLLRKWIFRPALTFGFSGFL